MKLLFAILWEEISQLIYFLTYKVSILTVGICKKLPFAILQGVDILVDQPLDV